jgi:hypothetical protein
MSASLPILKLPVSYEDLLDRLFLVRELIYEAMPREDVVTGGMASAQQFEEDIPFREAVAEILLASILWIEAQRPTLEILQDCEPQIRKGLVAGVNRLVDFLHIKKHTQPNEIVSRCSLADAWIHLLVEYRDMLRDSSQDWLWKRVQVEFVSEKYRP